jgi:hypothetical protein
MTAEEYLIIVLLALFFIVLIAIKIIIFNERLKYENHVLRFVAAVQQAELDKLKGKDESITTENVERVGEQPEIS